MAAKFKIFCDEQQSDDEIVNQKRSLLTSKTATTTTTGAASATNAAAAANLALKISAYQPQQPNQNQQQHQKGCDLTKREPLAMRQTAKVQAIQAPQLQPLQTQQPINGASAAANTNNDLDEDQENDISMASLGSDFIPSILNDDGESFYVEDEEEDEEGLVEDEDEDEVIDLDDDQELQMELSKAFKAHDESQLFKSVSYVEDIKFYLFNLERNAELRALPNYMDFQSEIDSNQRLTLINWLVEVADEYELQSETLFITIGLIDRFLSKMSIPTKNFQLLGVAAMFIASKYEEIYPPNLYQFVEITDDTFSGQQIRQMEQEILKTLDFRISMPTVGYFLNQIFAFNKFSKQVYDLAEYFCYLSVLFDQPFLEYYPSEIALASVILAAQQLNSSASISSTLWHAFDQSNINQLRRRQNLPQQASKQTQSPSTSSTNPIKSSESNSDNVVDRRLHIVNKNLPFCIEALVAIQKEAHLKSSKAFEDAAVVQKFSSTAHNSVALLKPPKNQDFQMFQDG